MNKISFLLMVAFLCLISSPTFSQNDEASYFILWKRVHKLELEDLPKSASGLIDSIHTVASQEGNDVQFIKSLIYQAKFLNKLEENSKVKIIERFNKEIERAQPPRKNILQSILAFSYYEFLIEHWWKIKRRSKLSTSDSIRDFRTWDSKAFVNEIERLFDASLEEDAVLKSVLIRDYNELLVIQDYSKERRPFLYDLLVHNAIKFYSSNDYQMNNSRYEIEISNEEYFSKFDKLDSLILLEDGRLSKPLKLYSELINFHQNDSSKDAILDAQINCLRFLQHKSVLDNTSELFVDALNNLKDNYIGQQIGALIDFEIAKSHFQESRIYNTWDESESHRFDRKRAMDICNDVISKFPKSKGAENCQILRKKILQKSLAITIEENVPVKWNSRILVEYKNIDSLYLNVYKVNWADQHKVRKQMNGADEAFDVDQLKNVYSTMAILPNEFDYQQHTTELSLPGFDGGNYLIIASLHPDYMEKMYAWDIFQHTNISLIHSNSSAKDNFQVINRINGEPLKDARVTFNNQRSNRKSGKINKSFTTNENGFFTYKPSRYFYDVDMSIYHQGDSALFNKNYLSEYYRRHRNDEEDDVTATPHLFLDRSIYRPGQTVYFKGILLQRKGDKSSLVKNVQVIVYLEDANSDEVDSLTLLTNEFGSFSGEFQLPKNGLTGEYNIYAEEGDSESKFYEEILYDWDYNEVYFSVEEYKRPRFEVEIEPIRETIKVNDSIHVKGKAIGYSGNNISNAQVKYSIKRRSRGGLDLYWRGWNNSTIQLVHGETTTDESGDFTISFLASPDLTYSKSEQPIFTYLIDVEVTDINGETRKSDSNVRAAYHSLNVYVNTRDIDLSKKEANFDITVKNLNDQIVPSKGKIEIFKLEDPQFVKRERPWPAPDYQIFTKEEFENLFPYDYYDNSNHPEDWNIESLVLEREIDTEISDQLALNQFSDWQSGKYRLVLTCFEKDGQTVTSEHHFNAFDSNSKTVQHKDLLQIEKDKSNYKIGEKAEITISSASKDLFVNLYIKYDQEYNYLKTVKLSESIEKLKIPVKSEYGEGFAIYYHTGNLNSFKSGIINFPIVKAKNDIIIETNTFRDRIQPGMEETWSFRLKGKNKNKVNAEILASMYDSSLDQFKSHFWRFDPLYQRGPYYNNDWSAYESFSTNNLRVRNRQYFRESYLYKNYDQLYWFGFSLPDNNYRNRNYLNDLKLAYIYSEVSGKNNPEIKKGFVKGIVVDEEGRSLTGVNISNKKNNEETITDINGKFTIKATKNDLLSISFLTYKTINLKINTSNWLEISMVASSEELSEVVVVGHAISRKKFRAGSAVADGITEEEVAFGFSEGDGVFQEEDGVFSQTLQGRAPGVVITRSSGSDRSSDKIRIRGTAATIGNNVPLYIIDGVIVTEYDLAKSEIYNMSLLKGESATALYGSRASNGVILITTQKKQKEIEAELSQVKVRKNLKETAFFFPHLRTDQKGNVEFSFNSPESLTKWKLQLLAHTQDLDTKILTKEIITQKDLMVIPNPPRFLRNGDEIQFSSKISNLTSRPLEGIAALQLFDAITGDRIDQQLIGNTTNQNFSVTALGNEVVSWHLRIPDNVSVIEYKVIAKAGNISDGEQSILPVLSNRILVTETLPLWLNSKEEKKFKLKKLESNKSTSLKNHALTLELTTNSIWFTIQSLPYLMEFPYECAEQTFARFYANLLGAHILNNNPNIKATFDHWDSKDQLMSKLEQNEELKSLLIQETPWLRDAQSESEQKKRMAALFDMQRMTQESKEYIKDLRDMQFKSGGFPWFKGSDYPNRYITQHIASGFGHLKSIGIEFNSESKLIVNKSVEYLDSELLSDYNILKQNARFSGEKKFWEKKHLTRTQVQYLYMRTFYNMKMSPELNKAFNFYLGQVEKYWQDYGLYMKAMMALILNRNNKTESAQKIMKSLDENSILNEELGMYWKVYDRPGYRWYESDIETQSLLIEAFLEIDMEERNDEEKMKTIEMLRLWLLKNKQTKQWKSTKATTEAIYALLLDNDTKEISEKIDIEVGDIKIPIDNTSNTSDGLVGYYKKTWTTNEIKPDMANVSISQTDDVTIWGGLYWQYFEDLDKITKSETPLKMKKNIYRVVKKAQGSELEEVTDTTSIYIGDLIKIRMVLEVDRDMDFVHMKDMRASGFEPVNVLSRYKYQDGLGYYESTKDASTNFFFENLNKGIYVFEYELRANNAGNFSNGITTIQSMYAPEFSSQSEGRRVSIVE